MAFLDVQLEQSSYFEDKIMSSLIGTMDENIRIIEKKVPVCITVRGSRITVTGTGQDIHVANKTLEILAKSIRSGEDVTARDLAYIIDSVKKDSTVLENNIDNPAIITTFRGKCIKAKTMGQREYYSLLMDKDIVFSIGPAGTGKTFLAVATAVMYLQKKLVTRIILTRPAVEAGEKLGFLPGDMQDKVDPYLRPLYDSLSEILGPEKFQRYMERGIIEVAPLAFMRGRTLDDAFIVLDEAQNTTREQMKMFLTRMGYGSRMVITGDVTQIDLPSGRMSGLMEARNLLSGISGIGFAYLNSSDVVRHPLVQLIVDAYAIEYNKSLDTEEGKGSR